MRPFTIKLLLVPLLTRPRVAQVVKWTVYLALIVNFGVYAYDDWMVYKSVLAPGAPWADRFEQFPDTIDMIAWLGLVFLLELETYARRLNSLAKFRTVVRPPLVCQGMLAEMARVDACPN